LTFIIKGAGSSSPFKDVPKQTLLIADNAKSTYAEGSESGDAPSFTSPAALQLGVGATGLVGSLEAGIVKAIGKSIGETPAVPLLSPAAKIV
jgi:hypothetical protein